MVTPDDQTRVLVGGDAHLGTKPCGLLSRSPGRLKWRLPRAGEYPEDMRSRSSRKLNGADRQLLDATLQALARDLDHIQDKFTRATCSKNSTYHEKHYVRLFPTRARTPKLHKRSSRPEHHCACQRHRGRRYESGRAACSGGHHHLGSWPHSGSAQSHAGAHCGEAGPASRRTHCRTSGSWNRPRRSDLPPSAEPCRHSSLKFPTSSERSCCEESLTPPRPDPSPMRRTSKMILPTSD